MSPTQPTAAPDRLPRPAGDGGLPPGTEPAGRWTGEQGVQPLAATFRNIFLVVVLLLVFAVLQMITLWLVGNAGMKTAAALEHQGLPTLYELASLQEHLAIYRLNSYEYIFAREGEKAARAKAAETVAAQTRAELRNIQALYPDGEGRRLAAELGTAIDDLDNGFRRVQNLLDPDFAAAMRAMDQDIPPLNERVDATAKALKDYGYHLSGQQANATFSSFGWIQKTAIMFGAGNILVALGAVLFVRLAARRSRVQLADTLARLDERTQELTRERARFKFIFDSVPVGLAWMEENQRSTRIVNPAHARITGVPMARCHEVEPYRQKTPPDDQVRQDALQQRLLAREIDHYDIEKRYVHDDGTIRWTLLSLYLYRDATSVDQEISTLVDITERKQAEEALREKQELLAAILENVADGILACNADGVITLSNLALREFHGLPLGPVPSGRRPEYFNLHLPDGITPMKLEQTPLFRALHGELVRDVETVITSKHRPVRRVLVSGQAFHDGQGAKAGAVVIVHDVTERKQAEAALEQANRERVDLSRQAGMAEVATGVLHNVGNVLNSVNVSAILVTDLVARSKAGNIAKLAALFEAHKADLAGFVTGDARGRMIPVYLATLAESLATEQQTLLRELDQLRKNIEHIKVVVAMQQSHARAAGVIETIPLTDLIEDALGLEAGSLARHEVGVIRDYQTRLAVTTDRHQVLQILINLVRNAKYACTVSGRKDRQLTVRTTADAQAVRIIVIDNGVGIPAENLTRIFNHGFTTRPDGHGFGLHNGALVAKELGGALSVQSDGPGRGATFTLELPLAPPRQTAAPAAGEIPSPR